MINEKIGRKVQKMASKPGLRGKVNAMCYWCTYDPEVSGTWREQVMCCSVTRCPLYPVRPRTIAVKFTKE